MVVDRTEIGGCSECGSDISKTGAGAGAGAAVSAVIPIAVAAVVATAASDFSSPLRRRFTRAPSATGVDLLVVTAVAPVLGTALIVVGGGAGTSDGLELDLRCEAAAADVIAACRPDPRTDEFGFDTFDIR